LNPNLLLQNKNAPLLHLFQHTVSQWLPAPKRRCPVNFETILKSFPDTNTTHKRPAL